MSNPTATGLAAIPTRGGLSPVGGDPSVGESASHSQREKSVRQRTSLKSFNSIPNGGIVGELGIKWECEISVRKAPVEAPKPIPPLRVNQFGSWGNSGGILWKSSRSYMLRFCKYVKTNNRLVFSEQDGLIFQDTAV